jgi:putative SOS response-associated peptidase YedK
MVNLKSFVDDLPWASLFDGGGALAHWGARYNIAPTQLLPVVANGDVNRFEIMRWGLVPSWAKDLSVGNRMINARAETIAEKPAFRPALRRRRCLVPVDGFYEWKRSVDEHGVETKQPMYIRMKGGGTFAFAGLWEEWGPDGEVLSFTIITTGPNELMRGIHDRMPVIVPRERYGDWLRPGGSRDEVKAEAVTGLLVPYPAEKMDAWPVGRGVNNPRNDSARNVERVGGVGGEEGKGPEGLFETRNSK